MAKLNVRFIPKKTAVPNRIPTGTTGDEQNYIKQGELAINTADKKLFSYDGANVFEVGENSFLNLTGGTISGNLSATTFYGSASGLTNIPVSALTEQYWYAGQSGTNSIRTIEASATSKYAVAQGFNTLASGNYSHAEGIIYQVVLHHTQKVVLMIRIIIQIQPQHIQHMQKVLEL
jgi:hypothetical protein